MKSGYSLAEPLPASGERFESPNAADSQMCDSTANSLDGQSSTAKSQRVTTEHAAPPSSENSPFMETNPRNHKTCPRKDQTVELAVLQLQYYLIQIFQWT